MVQRRFRDRDLIAAAVFNNVCPRRLKKYGGLFVSFLDQIIFSESFLKTMSMEGLFPNSIVHIPSHSAELCGRVNSELSGHTTKSLSIPRNFAYTMDDANSTVLRLTRDLCVTRGLVERLSMTNDMSRKLSTGWLSRYGCIPVQSLVQHSLPVWFIIEL
jgi:hypothetical protein